MKSYLFIISAFFWVPLLGNANECAKGIRSSLQYNVSDIPLISRHGQSVGQTKFTLRSEPGQKEVVSKEYEGNWFCIGFNRDVKTYIIGGIFELGAWLPLASIQYLREEKKSFEPSAFDQFGYLAMSLVASPSSGYVVFIGGRGGVDALYVLDVKQNTVRKLGQTPAPPPNLSSQDICKGEPFQWGTCWADHYIEMEKDIIYFKSERVLEVSYGNDTPIARAEKRWIRRFRLR